MELNRTKNENLTDFDNENPDDGFHSLKDIFHTLHAFGGILILCGIVENVLICWILACKKKYLKSFANFHLLNLAITDILFRIVATPDLLEDQIISKSDFTCKIGEFSKYTTLAVTFALLAGIALDRYIHIVHPFRARTVTWKHSRNLIALSWIYGALCSAPFLYSTKLEVYVDDETLETLSDCYDLPGLPFRISVTAFLVFSFVIPLVFMGVVYSKIVSVLWSRTRRNVINKNIGKIKIRAVKMMIVIVLTYLVTWGPMLLLKTVAAFYFDYEHTESEEDEDLNSQDELEQLKELLTWLILVATFDTLSLASSVLNPLIFGYYNASFREELKNIYLRVKGVKCFKKRNQKVAPCPIKIYVSTVSSEAKHTNGSNV
ncbi:QRFP-like peptide receptor [Oculina patagonica]